MSKNPKVLLILDRSNQPITDLHCEYFFGFPFLMELYLVNSNITYLPPSISQCILLEYVNISYNPMPGPPAILFSLPKLRKEPTNIIFGQNQKCTPKLMSYIINDAKHFTTSPINFVNKKNECRLIICPPDYTTYSLIRFAYPQYIPIIDSIVLVRKYEMNILKIPIDDVVPISLYLYPGSKWSIELKYSPQKIEELENNNTNDNINPNNTSHNTNYSANHNSDYNNNNNNNNNNDDMEEFEASLVNPHLKTNVKRFTVYLKYRESKGTDIGPETLFLNVTPEYVSFNATNGAYYVVDTNSISLTYAKENLPTGKGQLFLKLGRKKGLVIKKKSLPELIELFMILSTPQVDIKSDFLSFSKYHNDLTEIMIDTAFKFAQSKNNIFQGPIKDPNVDLNHDLDSKLSRLREKKPAKSLIGYFIKHDCLV